MYQSRKSRTVNPKTKSALHLGCLPKRFSSERCIALLDDCSPDQFSKFELLGLSLSATHQWQAIVGARHLEGIRMHQSRKSRTVNPKTKSALHLANPGMLNLEAKKRRVQCTKNINFLP
jgi:hypothetical protein